MRATDKQRGFTLLEIMVVIVIIGVLANLVVPNLMGNKEKADKQKPSAILWRWKTPWICTSSTIIAIQPQIRGLNP